MNMLFVLYENFLPNPGEEYSAIHSVARECGDNFREVLALTVPFPTDSADPEHVARHVYKQLQTLRIPLDGRSTRLRVKRVHQSRGNVWFVLIGPEFQQSGMLVDADYDIEQFGTRPQLGPKDDRYVFELTNFEIDRIGRNVFQQAKNEMGPAHNLNRIGEWLDRVESILSNAALPCTLGPQIIGIRTIKTEREYHTYESVQTWLETISRSIICDTHFHIHGEVVAISPQNKIVLDPSYLAQSRLRKTINVKQRLLQTDFQTWTVCQQCARVAGLRPWQIKQHAGGRIVENTNGARMILYGIGFSPDRSHIAAARTQMSTKPENYTTKMTTGQIVLPESVTRIVFSKASPRALPLDGPTVDEQSQAYAAFMREVLVDATRRLRNDNRRSGAEIDSSLRGVAFTDSSGRPMALVHAPAKLAGFKRLIAGYTFKSAVFLALLSLLLAVWLGQIPAVQEVLPPAVLESVPNQHRWIGPWAIKTSQILGALAGVILSSRAAGAWIGWCERSERSRMGFLMAVNGIITGVGIIALWCSDSLPPMTQIGATILISLTGFWLMPIIYNGQSSKRALLEGFPRLQLSIGTAAMTIGVALAGEATLRHFFEFPVFGLVVSAVILATISALSVYRWFPAVWITRNRANSRDSGVVPWWPVMWCITILPLLVFLNWFTGFSESTIYRILLSLGAVFASLLSGVLAVLSFTAIWDLNKKALRDVTPASPGAKSSGNILRRQSSALKHVLVGFVSAATAQWHRPVAFLLCMIAFACIWILLEADIGCKAGLTIATLSLTSVLMSLKDLSSSFVKSVKSINGTGLGVFLFGLLFAFAWSSNLTSVVSKVSVTIVAVICATLLQTLLRDLQDRYLPFCRIQEGAAAAVSGILLPAFAIPFIWDANFSLLVKILISILATVVLVILGVLFGLIAIEASYKDWARKYSERKITERQQRAE